MRNVDEIKRLKHEIGRYMKKIGDQQKEIKDLKQKLEAFRLGMRELNMATDMILARTAVDYGEEVRDEQTGATLGWRLKLVQEINAGLLEKYEVVSRYDKAEQRYIVAAMVRKEAVV